MPGAHLLLLLLLLGWASSALNRSRLLACLPTLWAIHVSGNSYLLHSLWTKWTAFGTNFTMALWLHEQGGRRVGAAVLVSGANAVMCARVLELIVNHR